MQVAESVSEAVGMSLGVRKCAVAHTRAGRVKRCGGVESLRAEQIREIEVGGGVPTGTCASRKKECCCEKKSVREIPATCPEDMELPPEVQKQGGNAQ